MQGVIGIDLGGTNVRYGLVTPDGSISLRRSHITEVARGRDYVIGTIVETVRALVLRSQETGVEVRGVGIGTPGGILRGEGVVTASPNFHDWKDVPLGSVVREGTGLRTWIENDANAVALGESRLGAGRDVASLVCLTLGTGVGGGIILDGRIWHGFLGMAGEIGHITIYPEGEPCRCGNRGCLEVYTSASGLMRFAVDEPGESMRSDIRDVFGPADTAPKRIYEKAKDGDEVCLRAFDAFGRVLGIGVAGVINILNVEMVCIAGGLSRAWDLFSPSMFREVVKRVYTRAGRETRLVPAVLGDDARILGAASAAMQAMGWNE